mmetsp:Transcript_2613/g.10107  ORF Transcript_2613/g.10107 Transcript_2613/m.10107 type:complete len:80 (+) Transcript_2613:2371-2610(+)
MPRRFELFALQASQGRTLMIRNGEPLGPEFMVLLAVCFTRCLWSDECDGELGLRDVSMYALGASSCDEHLAPHNCSSCS